MPTTMDPINNGANNTTVNAIKLVLLINAPVLAVIGWMAIVLVNNGEEMSVRETQITELQKDTVEQETRHEDTHTALGEDRYYRTEALEDNANLLARHEEHRHKDWHDGGTAVITEVRVTLDRLKKDVAQLERFHYKLPQEFKK